MLSYSCLKQCFCIVTIIFTSLILLTHWILMDYAYAQTSKPPKAARSHTSKYSSVWRIPPHKTEKPTASYPQHVKLYIYSQFIDETGNEETIVAITSCLPTSANKRPSLSIANKSWTINAMTECPEKHCTLGGYFMARRLRHTASDNLFRFCFKKARAFNSSSFSNGILNILSLDTDNKQSTERIPLPIVIVKSPQKLYHLTACISPMMYFVDWQNLIEFMELWHVNGLELLYAYWTSVSLQARFLIDFYASHNMIQTVEWPLLPDGQSVNILIYGQMVSYHDCLFRNKYTSNFTSFLDLDEILYVFKDHGQNLAVYLTNLPWNIAVVNFGSYYGYPNWDRTLKEQKLDEFSISDNFAAFPFTNFSQSPDKHIVRPEFVQRLHVHRVIDLSRRFKSYYALGGEAIILHLRRPSRPRSRKETQPFTRLQSFAAQADRHFHERLQTLSAMDRKKLLRTTAFSLFQRIDDCNLRIYHSWQCWSFARCESMLDKETKSSFLRANISMWYILETDVY